MDLGRILFTVLKHRRMFLPRVFTLMLGFSYSTSQVNATLTSKENESNKVPPEFVRDYFLYKNLGALYLLSCYEQDAYRLMEYLMGLKSFTIKLHTSPLLTDLTFVTREPFRVGYFLDMNCEFSFVYLTRVSEAQLFGSGNSWLIWDKEIQLANLLNISSLSLISDVVVSIPGVLLYDVYKIQPLKNLEIAPIGPLNHLTLTSTGNWHNTSGLSVSHFRRTNLKGITVVGAVVVTDLNVDPKNVSAQLQDPFYYPEIDIVNRYHFVLHQILMRTFNYKLKIVTTKTWGYVQSNGYFTGMMGFLQNMSIDLALSPSEVRIDRLPISEFLPSVHRFRLTFIFKQPQTLGTSSALAMPFSGTAWLCIAILVLACSLCLNVINRFNTHSQIDNSFVHNLILGIGAMAQQGFIDKYSRLSARTLSISVLFLGIMVYTYYNAAIVNSLLSPSPKTLRTLNQLVNSPLKLGMVDQPYLSDRFTATNPESAKAYIKMSSESKQPYILNLATGVHKVKKGGFAFYAEDAILYAEIDRTFRDNEKCALGEVEMLQSFQVSCAVLKHSQLRELISQGLLRLKETGLSEREDKKWYPQRPNCFGSQNIVSVNLEAMTIGLVIYVVGILISMVVFFFEKFLDFKNRKPEQINSKLWNGQLKRVNMWVTDNKKTKVKQNLMRI